MSAVIALDFSYDGTDPTCGASDIFAPSVDQWFIGYSDCTFLGVSTHQYQLTINAPNNVLVEVFEFSSGCPIASNTRIACGRGGGVGMDTFTVKLPVRADGNFFYRVVTDGAGAAAPPPAITFNCEPQ
jgi:hypothetical protein